MRRRKRIPTPQGFNDEIQVDRRETLIHGYDDFLKRYDWSWWGSLQLKSGRPTTKEAERRFNKWIEKLQAEEGTSKFRWVRIIEPGHLRRKPHASDRVLLNPSTGRPLTRPRLYQRMLALGKRAGVANAHPHRFRDTLAVDMLLRGGSPYDVAKILGDTIETVERHYMPFVKELRDRVRALLDNGSGLESLPVAGNLEKPVTPLSHSPKPNQQFTENKILCGSRTCKPNSVRLAAGRSFLWATHYCGAQATYPEVVARRAGTHPWRGPKALPGNPSLFGLAPCGVCPARRITAPAVRSYRTFSPLPEPCGPGGMFSVALSVERSRP